MKKYDLVIEMGSSNTVIYKRDLGIVLKEPTCIALSVEGKKKALKYVGLKARNKALDESLNLEIVEPVVEGVVINKQLAVLMMKEFLNQLEITNLSKLKVAFVYPVGLTPVEKNRVLSVAYELNFNSVALLPSVTCALVGMEGDLIEKNAKMVVIVGGGVTDIAILNGASIVRGGSVTISGHSLKLAILKFLKEEYYIIVSDKIVNDIIFNLVTLFESDTNKLSFSGIDIDTKNKKELTLTSKELLPVARSVFGHLAETIETILNMSSSEIITQINKSGVYLCGGVGQIPGLERFLREKIAVPVYIDTDCFNTVMNGAGTILENIALFDKVAIVD